MKTVKQPEWSGLCVAACIAMITGDELDDIVDGVKLRWCDEHGLMYVPLTECISSLAQRSYMYGLSLSVTNTEALAETRDLDLSVDLDQWPAILTVASPSKKGILHCVVWDPEKGVIRDPLPDKEDTSDFDRYDIREWTPVAKIKE